MDFEAFKFWNEKSGAEKHIDTKEKERDRRIISLNNPMCSMPAHPYRAIMEPQDPSITIFL